MAEKIYAEVPLSFLEYRVDYREPIFEDWGQHGSLALALFRAFRNWGIGLNNISGNPNPTNASEIRLTVDLLDRRMSFNIGLGAATFFVINPNWQEADVITRIALAGIEAVRTSTKADIDKQSITLAMHLVLKGHSIRDITSRFVQLDTNLIVGETVRAYGFAVYTEEGYLVVDTSSVYTEALFVRINRSFGPDKSFEEVANTLHKDENNALELLGLRID